MTYFVTIEGIEVKSNIDKQQAIKIAKAEYVKNQSVGIGKSFYRNGKRVYTSLPLYYYI